MISNSFELSVEKYMRSNILAHQLRSLSSASLLIVMASAITACSNDAARFDQMLTSSVPTTSNQSNIINKRNNSSDGIRVGPPPASRANSTLSPVSSSVSRSTLPAATKYQSATNYNKPTLETGGVPALPAYNAPRASNNALVLSNRKAPAGALKVVGTDETVTGSISNPVASVTKKETKKAVGWRNTKGAWVTVKKGETLYNLSRRYGVPVMAIMSANKISDANSVSSGQRVLIPTYNYSNKVPVSAPDSDPVTKASRASRGFQGQVRGKVAVPKTRAVISKLATVEPKTKPHTATKASGTYSVQSGDTLYRVARKHGVSVAQLRSRNNLQKDSLRIGQKLSIPNGGQTVVAKTVAKKKTDSFVTGSVASKNDGKKRLKPIYSAPSEKSTIANRAKEKVETVAKTNTGSFRWPAHGRVISKFGQRSSTGVNDGIDISMPIGTPIKASENGTVIYSGSELEDFGKLILLSHDGGWVTAYAHASTTLVRRGDKVRRGQVIAKSGRTGNATRPKLHFEIRKNSRPINPLSHLSN